MKVTIYNDRHLESVIKDIYNQFSTDESIQIEYRKPFKEVSLKQLGFFWGGLIDSVQRYYKSLGELWDEDDIKENFYSATAYLDERLKKTVTRFNGQRYEVPKRLSEMSIEEASIFIDKCIYLIDTASNFKDMVLSPDLRYTWVRHVTKDDLFNLKSCTFPRHDAEYLEHTRHQACIWCGKTHRTEAHHLKVAGYSGTAYKADDWLCVPLCGGFDGCHRKYHQNGENDFNHALRWITKYMSIIDFCKLRYNRWKYKEFGNGRKD